MCLSLLVPSFAFAQDSTSGSTKTTTSTQKKSTTTKKTRTVCQDVTVQDQPKDSHQITGMAVGAVAGGLLGNQVGGGKGKTVATVAGAVGGGYAGKKIQENQQAKNTHVERRCHEVTD
ncbi:glycine zipper 2TM domain-containing protein [Dyella terrae]|uniref:Glycine zipper 2TM domain-containing protein n=3 Tax=Rhodanobacteraceae TaxID=1775411 RepID=A0A4R0YRG4_9GAMM|nr:glycine zipper 2TM domain-containing protein [Dyella terrae]TCI08715.1 glycine zipper 2TM domain-containing protein [Dyella soli]